MKKTNKMGEKTPISTKLEKFAFNWMMNITKMGKTLNSKKFMMILPKIWTE